MLNEKSFIFRLTVMLVLATLMVGLLATPCLAAQKTKAQEDIGFTDENRVVRTDIKIVSDEVTASEGDLSGTLTALGLVPGEREATWAVTTYNVYGSPIYRFYSKVHWQWDYLRIYHVDRYYWGATYVTGWSYVGGSQFGYYYNNNYNYYNRANGTFRFGYGVYYYEYPWIEFRLSAGGGYTATGGK